jgi:hypothetical protein
MNQRLKNILIRLLYIIPLTVFIYALFSNWKDLDSESSFGLKYLYVTIVPIIIFAYQSIRNSIVGWILVIFLYLSYLTLWVYGLIEEYLNVGVKYSQEQYFSWWIFVILYLGLGYVYFKFRPKEIMI